MATIRIQKNKNFSIVSNEILRDKRLSLRARGLLVFCLSLADSWEYSIKGLAIATGESEGKISLCLKELEKYGYLTRERTRNAKGQMDGTNYTLWEEPRVAKPQGPNPEKPNVEKPILENPSLDNPIQEKPILENRGQENTKSSNNKYIYNNKPKQTQKNNTRACELQLIPFKSPAKIDREKRAVVGSAPPYTQEQRAIAEEYFNQFWEEYPKKQGQVEARLAWMRQNYSIETYIAIIKAVERFKQIRRDWQTEGGRYVPMPENFINNERWKDEVKTETVQFDRPMDIVTMAGMIGNEIRRQQGDYRQGRAGCVDCVEGSRADTAQSSRPGAISANDEIDVAAIWTP